jgi:hypothetical protein
MERILFVLKERFYSYSKTSYGLINSASHLAEALEHKGHKCKVVTVIDSNFIDKEIHSFKPTMVVLEALWVPTYKLKELIEIRRYKEIKWVVRIHSDMSFLSCESQALKLVNEYIRLDKHNLTISLNSKKFIQPLSEALNHKFTYLPNIISIKKPEYDFLEEKNHIDMGCFGATRLLKNQCFQALCAIKAADQLGKILHFHITPNLDQGSDPILDNLKEIFRESKHVLVIHDWLPNHEFQELVRRMDIGLQISYTESFNIVSADFINNNRLIVGSEAIDWLPNILKASTTDYEQATNKIVSIYKRRNSEWLRETSRLCLRTHNKEAKEEWEEFLKKHCHHDSHKGHKRFSFSR